MSDSDQDDFLPDLVPPDVKQQQKTLVEAQRVGRSVRAERKEADGGSSDSNKKRTKLSNCERWSTNPKESKSDSHVSSRRSSLPNHPGGDSRRSPQKQLFFDVNKLKACATPSLHKFSNTRPKPVTIDICDSSSDQEKSETSSPRGAKRKMRESGKSKSRKRSRRSDESCSKERLLTEGQAKTRSPSKSSDDSSRKSSQKGGVSSLSRGSRIGCDARSDETVTSSAKSTPVRNSVSDEMMSRKTHDDHASKFHHNKHSDGTRTDETTAINAATSTDTKTSTPHRLSFGSRDGGSSSSAKKRLSLSRSKHLTGNTSTPDKRDVQEKSVSPIPSKRSSVNTADTTKPIAHKSTAVSIAKSESKLGEKRRSGSGTNLLDLDPVVVIDSDTDGHQQNAKKSRNVFDKVVAGSAVVGFRDSGMGSSISEIKSSGSNVSAHNTSANKPSRDLPSSQGQSCRSSDSVESSGESSPVFGSQTRKPRVSTKGLLAKNILDWHSSHESTGDEKRKLQEERGGVFEQFGLDTHPVKPLVKSAKIGSSPKSQRLSLRKAQRGRMMIGSDSSQSDVTEFKSTSVAYGAANVAATKPATRVADSKYPVEATDSIEVVDIVSSDTASDTVQRENLTEVNRDEKYGDKQRATEKLQGSMAVGRKESAQRENVKELVVVNLSSSESRKAESSRKRLHTPKRVENAAGKKSNKMVDGEHSTAAGVNLPSASDQDFFSGSSAHERAVKSFQMHLKSAQKKLALRQKLNTSTESESDLKRWNVKCTKKKRSKNVVAVPSSGFQASALSEQTPDGGETSTKESSESDLDVSLRQVADERLRGSQLMDDPLASLREIDSVSDEGS